MSNKFGMFIHWGIYSLLEIHEQVLARWDLPKEEYEQAALKFNPTEYDPEKWVLLAKNAGMKYICFTAKHHDGFCMWDTKYTSYNIMNTPYGKDVLKMLSDACKKHGMLLSIYYSNPDWHHPNAYNPLSSHQWRSEPETSDRAKYISFVKAQITELLTNYGEIYTFFWDIPPKFEDRSINELVRHLQPGILINDRGYDEGDFSTPERTVPDGTRFVHMTEACQSVGMQSWGYRANEDYYSERMLMSSIDKIMAMGGSYLLNVGPMANGEISSEACKIIKRIGEWYTKLDGALENTVPDTFEYKLYSDDKFIALKKNGKTYLHFYNGLSSTGISFAALPGTLSKAVLLNSGKLLNIKYEKMPELWNDPDCSFAHHIYNIPIDDYPTEPIVIELTWQ